MFVRICCMSRKALNIFFSNNKLNTNNLEVWSQSIYQTCFLVGTLSQLEAVTLDLAIRSSSFSVILMKPLIAPISLHLQSRSNIFCLLGMHCCLVLPYWLLLFICRYSSINEINKISQESTGSKVFVYFITRLPRMEGGTSYVGFHGGKVTTTCEFKFCYHIVWRII